MNIFIFGAVIGAMAACTAILAANKITTGCWWTAPWTQLTDHYDAMSTICLREVFLTGPKTKAPLCILDVRGAESDLRDHFEIDTGNGEERWRFKIEQEEV